VPAPQVVHTEAPLLEYWPIKRKRRRKKKEKRSIKQCLESTERSSQLLGQVTPVFLGKADG
jgi:hypothetical protein